VLDLGCGVGNTTLPLLELNPSLELWSCDFSPNAVELMVKKT
jgi:16S rRNA G1207 methylase RsmC